MNTRIGGTAVLTLAAVGILAGCAEQPDTVESSTVTVTVESKAGGTRGTPGQDAQPAPQDSKSNKWSDRGKPGVPDIHEAAGGPIPPEAREVATIRHNIGDAAGEHAVFTTPSGNIDCTIVHAPGVHSLVCGVESYRENRGMGSDSMGRPRWLVDVLHREVFMSDAQYVHGHEPGEGVEPEVVPYGTIVRHGPFACAVEETGVTCWDSRTGRGAWMERQGSFFFDPIDYQIWEYMDE